MNDVSGCGWAFLVAYLLQEFRQVQISLFNFTSRSPKASTVLVYSLDSPFRSFKFVCVLLEQFLLNLTTAFVDKNTCGIVVCCDPLSQRPITKRDGSQRPRMQRLPQWNDTDIRSLQESSTGGVSLEYLAWVTSMLRWIFSFSQNCQDIHVQHAYTSPQFIPGTVCKIFLKVHSLLFYWSALLLIYIRNGIP